MRRERDLADPAVRAPNNDPYRTRRDSRDKGRERAYRKRRANAVDISDICVWGEKQKRSKSRRYRDRVCVQLKRKKKRKKKEKE
jgi:hypothetical protein